MPKTILRLKIRDSRSLLRYTLITLLILTSAALADENQFLLHLKDLKDPGSLAVKLQDTCSVVSNPIVAQLSAETQRLLDEYDGISSPSLALQRTLILDLNKILQAGPLYDAESFVKIELSEETDALLAKNPQSGEALGCLNRLLLSDAYPHEVASPTEKRIKNAEGIEKCKENLRRIQVFSDNAPSKSQARLTTFLLDRELIVKDMVIDFDPDILSQKVKQSIESKD